MDLVADRVRVAGSRSDLLPPTSLEAPAARVTPILGDPGYGHVALALALAGRVDLAAGHIRLDGQEDRDLQRRVVALVDVPEVSAPEDGLTVAEVVSEELAFAGRRSGLGAARTLLDGLGLADTHKHHFEELAPGDRVRVLTTTASMRAATRVLVLAHPDRRGGDPHEWWPHVESLARSGLTCVVQITHATARVLRLQTPYELGVTP